MPVGKNHQHLSLRLQDMRSSPSWANLRPPLRGDSPRQWTPGTVINRSHIWQRKRKKFPLSSRHGVLYTVCQKRKKQWLTESAQLDHLLQPLAPKLCFQWPSPSPPTSPSCGHCVCRPCWVKVQQRKNKNGNAPCMLAQGSVPTVIPKRKTFRNSENCFGKNCLLFLRLVLEFGYWNSRTGFSSEIKFSSSLTVRIRAVARMQQCQHVHRADRGVTVLCHKGSSREGRQSRKLRSRLGKSSSYSGVQDFLISLSLLKSSSCSN